jgi:hypothetical protein
LPSVGAKKSAVPTPNQIKHPGRESDTSRFGGRLVGVVIRSVAEKVIRTLWANDRTVRWLQHVVFVLLFLGCMQV